MNNVSGFSGALVASNPLIASEQKTGGDSAANPKGQSFETLLTGLSQQSETPANSPSTADGLTGQGGAQSQPLHSNALTLLTQAVTSPTSQASAGSQTSGKTAGQNPAGTLGVQGSAESPIAAAAAMVPGAAGRAAPEQEAGSAAWNATPASRPQSATAQTQSSSAQRQRSNTVPVIVSAPQPISAANETASTEAVITSSAASSSAAVTSVSQKSPESGQSSNTRERRHSATQDSSQTQPQPAANVTASALLAAAVNVMPANVQQAVTADSESLSTAGDNAASGSTTSSVIDEAAITKISLTSHGATSKSDSTEDSTSSTKVEVVSQVTYFAPVASLSPAQQIANAVAPLVTSSDAAGQDSSAASSLQAATPATDIGAMLAAAQPSLSVVKTLDLQLEPPDLGTVNVKLNLSDGGLEVEVQASQSATRDLLEKDKQELTDRLADTGYAVTSVDISLAASSSTANSFADQSTTGQSSSGQTSEGTSQGNNGSQGQDGGANNSSQRQSQRQSGNETYETARSASRRPAGAGLYI
jgi:hypothetical protein